MHRVGEYNRSIQLEQTMMVNDNTFPTVCNRCLGTKILTLFNFKCVDCPQCTSPENITNDELTIDASSTANGLSTITETLCNNSGDGGLRRKRGRPPKII